MNSVTHLKMGTRGSALARAQSGQVARQLEALHPQLRVEEVIIRTSGDARQQQPLPEIGGKGLFTLEIENALLEGTIDFAVHSLKDLPPAMPTGLCLASVPPRENPCDALVLHPLNIPTAETANLPLKILPLGSRIGTSSLRRQAMLLHLRPDLQVESIRGNIDSRIRKMQEMGFHAILLAKAGLLRLGLVEVEAVNLPESWFIPAPGQGALALQARSTDLNTRAVLMSLEHAPTRFAVEAERAMVAELGAGCSTPLGALAHASGETLSLHAAVLSTDGKTRVSVTIEGSGNAELIGRRAASSLLEKGAGPLLSDIGKAVGGSFL